jgi:hypothetical protein
MSTTVPTQTPTHSPSKRLQTLPPSPGPPPLQYPQFKEPEYLHNLINLSGGMYNYPNIVIPEIIEDVIQKPSLEQEHGEYHRFHRSFVHKMHFQGVPRSEFPDHVNAIGAELEDLIEQVKKSVGESSSKERIKRAFVCMAWFGEELENTEGGKKYLKMQETYGSDEIMENLVEGLEWTADLLKGKGGLTKEEIESDEMERVATFLEEIDTKEGYAEFSFLDVRRTVFGELPSSDWSSDWYSDDSAE